MIQIHSSPTTDLTESINGLSVRKGELACWWLGQAGFVLRSSEACCIIDPYLSNSLALKYKDTQFTHQRMMPIPVSPEELKSVDGIFCTHHHSDHLDPGTLVPLLGANPSARLVAPRASLDRLVPLGLDTRLSDPVNPQLKLSVVDFKVTVVPASHETIETDSNGNHRFVGYVMETAGLRIYHSGDCIPFDGQAELLRPFAIDLALLPINGRDEMRRSNGIPGNFTIDEAIRLCRNAGIKNLLCHHFEMFDFNTIDRDYARHTLEEKAPFLQWLLPQLETTYIFTSDLIS